ncbi:hypothetical protein DM43_5758 [Burkholderia cepacia]|uniref:Uncharacterized protein n=1 Tax=Burkholderia cepacia TaxID=292 RepID=A0AA89CLE5_BURCE|nr:hypothetical protein DM43_5758 [Burkholderia cepacia]
MPGAGSPSCSAFRKRVDSALNSHATSAPVASPPAATITNVTDAARSENTPVSAAAIANFSATRPDASFISASPSRMCISCGGMRPLPAMPDSATASVGDSTAASANAIGSGNSGISQCAK